MFSRKNSMLSARTLCATQVILSEAPFFAVGATEPCWFALYTCANHEKRVAVQLEARGVEHFLPLYRSRRNWKDRRVFLDLPLFPGYVFAHFEWTARVHVLQARGVVRLVGSKGHPSPLAKPEIEALRAGVRGGLRLEPHSYLPAGTRVRILHGPLAGMTGILARKKNSFRVVLSVDLIARSVALEVDAADIERIG
ncbi:MAG TPA: UpxY family transcription antiterminator [Candidatus Acidoferrum sp.]|nr:UpxY family transcription antiterminator [Candidatus Acidoferrum sp.]